MVQVHAADGCFLFCHQKYQSDYSFPKKVVTKWGLGGLSVYGSIENAATFTARKGMNPQYSFSGSQDNTFVAARVFTLGLNLNF